MTRLLHYTDLEGVYDDPESFGRLVGCLDTLREDALVVGAGDDMAPSVSTTVIGATAPSAALGALDPDIETFGNHDFDHGVDFALTVASETPATYVSANLRVDGHRFGHGHGVEPWTVRDVDGTRVGVFGVTTTELAAVSDGTLPIEVTDPVAASRDAVAALREAGAEVVVCLAHLGDDQQIARETEVDVICGGHVAPARSERIDGTLLVRPDIEGRSVFEIDLDDREATLHDTDAFPPAERGVDAIHSFRREAGLDEPVARLDAPVELPEYNGAGETRIGNFVADAIRWDGDADVGIYHDGGLRGDRFPAGEVTAFDLASTVPFTDSLCILDVSGDRLRAVLRQLDGRCLGLADERSWFGNVSGARIVRNASDGTLVEATVDGAPIDDDRHYSLALPSYLSTSDHVIDAVGEDDVVRRTDVPVYESVIEYAREFGVAPEVEGRMRER
ncbi:2',3'-cyclic-nucleotide 2'-phosphodiesterase/5'-or 3'-nucleotidase, 5'-nucleotidase family [Natronoarchaeum philippinense]|uniref:2',3'-cyclic-nucleotide 2'-phosphodiesterase/5'-or 3'-nucleotidase, 5'-nucleotidase family n=1 Tax=Natronoarchaeum philippinense TaxID=558529 RepID=A0A285N4L0_NATPI|nr:bifunctional metallophosphatase/5'-nucleotidase [Natronoarchaeum philippinense]SNZ04392.1 2',3'-cyclic-nucleotide 2'-phosphodiesterase/5'-or 3'-nucleotidase, 5'-nucleotidase family [Natronoarchaeum philippinense]